ncbi:hypothetical protein HMPREF0551_2173 [Lautropia mirabilis ATCC 51599]|uniref:Uncharacterized protein n=1 Tax=Lautropia mirabilis ATCC 51599 TaxID=887898 RepID=E7RZQ9_9BURK|nr:hypothetical protein HMPREF0551_2173 [Lautropia mirabilis ATCC 51599]
MPMACAPLLRPAENLLQMRSAIGFQDAILVDGQNLRMRH